MAASSVQKFGAPGRGPIRSVSFVDLLPISDLIGGAVGAAPEFGKFWMLPWRLGLAGTVEAGRGGQG